MSRIAVVDNERLKDMSLKKYIQSLCPVNRAGTECIQIEDGLLTIDELTCIGCGICIKAATDAIKIVNLPEILTKSPIHRYGENAFALFSLPTPLFRKVVGIIGVNGIGKSSAVSILSGFLKPNLGKLGEQASYDDLIAFFKGTEVQSYFEKMKKKDIIVSYKPQHVQYIPKQFKGTVRQLLEKVDEKKQLQEIVKMLDINAILDSDITNISGGELQRVAIAACVLKKAHLYIFDEPTSYLDIKQRMLVSHFIKELANEQTAVIVIEHDLIILDFISDVAQIMFGSADVYGSISQPKPAKNAINTYLSGFLKEENIRFREKEIKFTQKKPFVKRKEIPLVAWSEITKKMDTFSLHAKAGAINQSEVIGVLGENGIGKTTFVKMLAKEMKPDTGDIDEKVTVSYKPQYIEGSEELVMAYLKDAMSKYTNQLINPLDIKPLLLKKLNELSGGELQRVAIAHCLGKEAQLYLLDEPSAYLDVEQRLNVSKVIRDYMEMKASSALIVDHDLLFLDYLSDKIMVFEGIPAKEGFVRGPFLLEEGMNLFLKNIQITLRRDKDTMMPRINKPGSVLDREQISQGKYYYG